MYLRATFSTYAIVFQTEHFFKFKSNSKKLNGQLTDHAAEQKYSKHSPIHYCDKKQWLCFFVYGSSICAPIFAEINYQSNTPNGRGVAAAK
jgi:hypothetical protein